MNELWAAREVEEAYQIREAVEALILREQGRRKPNVDLYQVRLWIGIACEKSTWIDVLPRPNVAEELFQSVRAIERLAFVLLPRRK